jgi:hypothetical protein
MSPAETLAALRAADVELQVVDGWRLYGVPEAIAAFELGDLSALRAELVWRWQAMLRQIPASGGIPVLVAREAPGGPGLCASCGEPSSRFRCGLCQVAASAAIADSRPTHAPEPAEGASS